MNAKAGKVDSPSVPRGKLTASEAEQLLLTVNSAAQRIQVLWISFISFGAYVTIAVLGTTHRMLFLEEPVRLPAFNIDLPLQSFYVILPGFFLLFHFYVLVQLILFSRTVAAFEESLIRGVQTETDRELVRMRLDNSLFVQRLAGAEAERIGRNAWFIRLITWLTVVVCPVALLLLIQLKFLPFHHFWVTTFHRLVLTVDLLIILVLWPAYSRNQGFPSIPRSVTSPATVSVVLIFVWFIAVFPSESLYKNAITRLPGTLVTTWPNSLGWMIAHRVDESAKVYPSGFIVIDNRKKRPQSTYSFTEILLEPKIDYVSGKPAGVFSNVIVVPDQVFVDDREVRDLDKLESTADPDSRRRVRTFRGRDLSGAILSGADLRRSDFTGANLNFATFEGARLNSSRFGCDEAGTPIGRERGSASTSREYPTGVLLAGCGSLERTNFDRAELAGAYMRYAQFAVASFATAQLDGAWLDGAKLDGADLSGARLNGASLTLTKLQGAQLSDVQLQGAILYGADLQLANLRSANLRGASLEDALLRCSNLEFATLEGVELSGAALHGASFERTVIEGTSLRFRALWRSLGNPKLGKLVTIDEPDWTPEPLSADAKSQIGKIETPWGTGEECLSLLDLPQQPERPLAQKAFASMPLISKSQGLEKKIAEYLTNLACTSRASPFVARGLIISQRLKAAGPYLAEIWEKLKDAETCSGAKGLRPEDFIDYEAPVRQIGIVNLI